MNISLLGREEDYFIGDIDRDWIETGGGADNIYAGAGDDVIKIQANLPSADIVTGLDVAGSLEEGGAC